jgi:hypothetical protein
LAPYYPLSHQLRTEVVTLLERQIRQSSPLGR